MTGQTKHEILETIYRAIDRFNQQNNQQVKKSPDTILYGSSSSLDSLGLIHFIVAVEEAVEESYGSAITLADERALSPQVNAFASVSSLAAYVGTLVAEKA